MYEVFEHTADLGLRVRAATLDRLMADAACGLFAIIAGDLDQIRTDREETFAVAGDDPTWLLFDWIGELHAAFELRKMLFRSFTVHVDAEGLRATARGEPYDPGRHALAHEVKAVTQHALEVGRTPDGWQATLIVDI